MATAIIRATRVVRYAKQSELVEGVGLFAPTDDVVEVQGFRAMRLTFQRRKL